MFLRCIFLLAASFFYASAFTQERCGTTQYESLLKELNPKKETTDSFEKWMLNKLDRSGKTPLSTQRIQASYSIPVVIHVIHNGEAVGTGINISDAQIASQIKVLNNDFNRLNADQSNTPTIFQSVASSFDVQFVLAKQDPNGLATNGIVRVKGSKSIWSAINDNYALKSQSYWPAEQYLNIWVTSLSDFLGYTQFPVSSLAGLENSSNERLTDGIAVNYREFGSDDDGAFNLAPRYNKGRTLTHEMGHFFGLRHIWGDISACNGTDYVTDTPTQSTSTAGCPVHPQADCSAVKMFQNYLDYTDDQCMNLFTQGQVARMTTVIQNSPRRKELPTSIGLLNPVAVANDLGIKSIAASGPTACSGNLVPSVLVRNYGNNSITNAQLQLMINNVTVETKNIILSLAPDQEQTINFNTVSLSASTSSKFDFKITFTNSIVDGNSANNLKTITTITPSLSILPITESFATLPTNWTINNPDGLTTWKLSPSISPGIFMDLYNYTEIGAIDQLVTPQLDVSAAPTATIIFERAYAQYSGVTGEGLRLLASSACRFDNSPTILFNKSDAALATATARTSPFVPASSDWVTEVISLNQFIGQPLQLAFESTNADGNNLYLRNVRIITNTFTDVALLDLSSAYPIVCTAEYTPQLKIKNNGNLPITSFTVASTLNNVALPNKVFSGLSIASNTEQIISLEGITLIKGINQLSFSLVNPNGGADFNMQDNARSFTIAFSNAKDIIPLRENFDSDSKQNWTIVSQNLQPMWQSVSTNFNNSLFYNSFSNTTIGNEAWLISPILDLSSISKAGVFFDVSYASRSTGSEVLQIRASTDCGLHFNDILFNKTGNDLTTTADENAWLPSMTADWKKYFVNLDSYISQSSFRMAFVVTNNHGNNLYLDNIEFFADDNNNPVASAPPYSVYGGILSPLTVTFNLDTRQPVSLQVYNSVGQLITDNLLVETLNQTYTFHLGDRGKGIYIVRVQIGNQLSSKKVYVGD